MPTSRLPLRLIRVFVYVSSINRRILICYFNARAVFRVGLCVTVIESLILLIIVPFRWPFL